MEEYRIIALYAVATSTALKAIGWVWGKRKYDEDGQYDETECKLYKQLFSYSSVGVDVVAAIVGYYFMLNGFEW